MSVDEQYAECPTCKVVYRPGVQGSRQAHHQVHGHWPPDHPVRRPAPPRPQEQSVTPGELLRAAAVRIGELQAVVDGLDALAATWEKAPAVDPVDGPGLGRAAEMLRGYLARPPIHALDEEAPDGD